MNNKGITLITLVITIVVMLILISITGYFTMDNVKNAYIAGEKKELSDVVDYTSLIRAKVLTDDFSFEDEKTIITSEALYLLAISLDDVSKNNIIEVNSSDALDLIHKYHYITPKELKDKNFSDRIITVNDAKNNYIINFYTGTVIALYDNGERYDVSGNVIGLEEIVNEI